MYRLRLTVNGKQAIQKEQHSNSVYYTDNERKALHFLVERGQIGQFSYKNLKKS